MQVVIALALVGRDRRRGAPAADRRPSSPASRSWPRSASGCVPEGPLWNARLLPFWYLCLYLLAGVAVAELGAALAVDARRRPRPSRRRGARAVTPVLDRCVVVLGFVAPARCWQLAVVGAAADGGRTPTTSASSRAGPGGTSRATSARRRIPSTRPGRHDGRARPRRGCGRAMWEYELKKLDRYGTPMALMLLPYWTDGCIGSMEGLFFEASATTPYHFLNQSELSQSPSRAMRDLPYRGLDVASGVQHLQLLGVRYYMAFTPEAVAQADANPDLRLIATSGPWQVYEVARSAAGRGRWTTSPPWSRASPPAASGTAPTGSTSRSRSTRTRSRGTSRWPTTGPKEWPRVAWPSRRRDADGTAGTDIRIDRPARRPVTPAKVSSIRTDDDRISFDVDRPGTPVLVKASYFPNWKASGAKGPWRVTPNLMVVVPTEKHVSLHYGWTAVDGLGWLITLVGARRGVVVLVRRGSLDFPQPEQPDVVTEPDRDDELDGRPRTRLMRRRLRRFGIVGARGHGRRRRPAARACASARACPSSRPTPCPSPWPRGRRTCSTGRSPSATTRTCGG